MRRLLIGFLAISLFGQSLMKIVNQGDPKASWYTTHTTGFAPVYSKTGSTLIWAWPDGTFDSSNSPTKTLASGTKRVEVQSQDGFGAVTAIDVNSMDLTGSIPSLSANTALTVFDAHGNQLTGSIPSLSANTALTVFDAGGNQLTGSIPSLSANTALSYFDAGGNQLTGSIPSLSANTALTVFYAHGNQLTGSIPSLSANTALTVFYAGGNQLTGSIPSLSANTALTVFYAGGNQLTGSIPGSFATQQTLANLDISTNALPSSDIDQILADLVVSLSISGRVVCDVELGGGTNGPPTGQGITDKATLIAGGWTVVTN
jgi:Leucine-rich repeat (LRR) protein